LSIQSLLANSTQFMTGDAVSALSAIAGGADIVLLASAKNVLPYVFAVSKDVRRPQELKGRIIATSQIGGRAGEIARMVIRNIGLDFEGLHDEAATFTARAKKMEREKPVSEALKHERNEFARENQLNEEIWRNEQRLTDSDKRSTAMNDLRDRLEALVKQANADADSSDRRIARRVTRNVAASGGPDSNRDPDYQKLLQKLGLTGRPR